MAELYSEMSPGDMLNAVGTDAAKWATAFREQYPQVPQDVAVGWFSNAMMAMWDLTNSRITHSDEALADHISALVRNRDLWRELVLEGQAGEGIVRGTIS
jgi:hypothetical protein